MDEQFMCPYCGEYNPLIVDVTGGKSQQFIVDCEVCCAPIVIRLKIRGEEIISIDARKENE